MFHGISLVCPSFLWFPLTASLLSTGTRGLSLANAPGVVPLSSAQVRPFFSLHFFHLLTVSFPPPTFSLNHSLISRRLRRTSPLTCPFRHASPLVMPLSHRPLATRPICRVAPSPRVALVASLPRHTSLHRHASPLSHPPFATRRPRVTVLTLYSVPTSALLPPSSDACTFSSFFFSLLLIISPLYRYTGPLSLASCEGGCPLLFHDAAPFPLINA